MKNSALYESLEVLYELDKTEFEEFKDKSLLTKIFHERIPVKSIIVRPFIYTSEKLKKVMK